MHRRRGPERSAAPFRATFIASSRQAPMAPTDVLIFDTTLRDGEQAPGNSLPPEEKLRLARQLDALGVDVIEAGFPAASEGDFRERPRDRRRDHGGRSIAALARCHERDIDLAGEALRARRERGRIHVFISTSDLHMREKLRIDPRRGARAGPRGDPPGAPVHRRRRVLRRGRQPHRSRLPLPGGAGGHRGGGHRRSTCPTPWATPCPRSTARCSATCCARVPGADRVVLSAHCHDDLGLARRPTRWPRSRPGRGRWSARSTASASGRATPRWRRS